MPSKLASFIHVVAGVFAAGLYHWYAGLSIALLTGFLIYEYWQSRKTHDDGYKDFRESLIGAFIGAIIILILRLTGVI